MEKVYIKNKQGDNVLPITHVSAVLDDQGNNVGSIIGTFEDEVRGLVDTPHQNYVTVSATSSTTSATSVLPASGQSADTIYRVANWDGSTNSGAGSFDVTKYSEYAWDDVSTPAKYVFLCVKSQIDEVFDITIYNNNTTYADLAAALGNDGANIPQSLRRGGMSVKYVQSYDNKYVQFRLISDSFTTDVTKWQDMDTSMVGILVESTLSKKLIKEGSVTASFKFLAVDLIKGKGYRVNILSSVTLSNCLVYLCHDTTRKQEIYTGTIQANTELSIDVLCDYDDINFLELSSSTTVDENTIYIYQYINSCDDDVEYLQEQTKIFKEILNTYVNPSFRYISYAFEKDAVYKVKIHPSINLSNCYMTLCHDITSKQILFTGTSISAQDGFELEFVCNEDNINFAHFETTTTFSDTDINIVFEKQKELKKEVVDINNQIDKILDSEGGIFIGGEALTINNTKLKTNGTTSSASGFSCTDFIEVDSDKYDSIYYSGVFPHYGDNGGMCMYDASKQFIGSHGKLATTSGSGIIQLASYPSLKYIRFDAYGSEPRVVFVKKDNNIDLAVAKQQMMLNTNIVNKITLSKSDSTADFSNIIAAVKAAKQGYRNEIYILDGTWDIYQEYIDYYGSDYWDNYTNESPDALGIRLNYNTHLYFASRCKVVFNYQSDNETVQQDFSPFYCGYYGCGFHNMNIEASRCRYCVHDERGSSSDAYTNVYEGCVMKLDNTHNDAPNWQIYARCIGGGLGKDGNIVIQNCHFTGIIAGGSTDTIAVDYHNNAAANSKSRIQLHNCYFAESNGFGVGSLGESTEITEAYVSGCSFGRAIEARTGTPTNVSVVEWNNIVRS